MTLTEDEQTRYESRRNMKVLNGDAEDGVAEDEVAEDEGSPPNA